MPISVLDAFVDTVVFRLKVQIKLHWRTWSAYFLVFNEDFVLINITELTDSTNACFASENTRIFDARFFLITLKSYGTQILRKMQILDAHHSFYKFDWRLVEILISFCERRCHVKLILNQTQQRFLKKKQTPSVKLIA